MSRLALRVRLLCWRPVPYWSLVAATVLLGSAHLVPSTPGSQGSRRSAVVATRSLEPGRVVEPSDVELRPAGVVQLPASVLNHVEDAIGRTVVAAVPAGEAVVDARLSERGRVGMAALVGPGRVAIDVATPDGSTLDLDVGQTVDLVGVGFGVAGVPPGTTGDLDEPGGSDQPGGPRSGVVAAGAVVLAVGERFTSIAVLSDELVGVAAAMGAGEVLVALRGD